MLTFKPRAMLRAIFIRSRFPKRSPILLSTPACFRRNWTSCYTIIKISISVTFLCNYIRNNSGNHLFAVQNLNLSPFECKLYFQNPKPVAWKDSTITTISSSLSKD
ncbi:hypothetical protein V8G54_008819 [Vigna mungo]|uniref:Uncharacterized protein n=1 Tax=Vigna mungo TaxID=3915 RepID=A0AAQ3S8K5_VIGMU